MNIVVVEDESHTAFLLKEVIEQDKDFMVVEVLESVVEAVAYLSKYQQNIDLLFFDIQLADGQSFEIFKHIDVVVPVIFCTAYDDYSLQAIKNNGIDYVLKPFKEAQIHSALIKYKQLITNLQMKNRVPVEFRTEDQRHYQQHFLTQFREYSLVVKVEDVAMFAVEHDTVSLYTYSGKKYPLFKKLEYIESVCDPATFFRINRQMLINRKSVVSFEPYFNRKIVLQLNVESLESPVVSRMKVSQFKEWLEQ